MLYMPSFRPPTYVEKSLLKNVFRAYTLNNSSFNHVVRGPPSTLTIQIRIPLKPTVFFQHNLCLKRAIYNQKEAGVGPFLKKLFFLFLIMINIRWKISVGIDFKFQNVILQERKFQFKNECQRLKSHPKSDKSFRPVTLLTPCLSYRWLQLLSITYFRLKKSIRRFC